MKKVLFMVFLVFCLSITVANATTITEVLTFEELPVGVIEDGYYGFDFDYSSSVTGSSPSDSGYGIMNSSRVAYNAHGRLFGMSSDEPFSVVGAVFTPAWRDNLLLEVAAYSHEVLVSHQYFFLEYGVVKFLNLELKDITKFVWGSNGGDFVPGLNGMGTQAVMDNLVITRNSSPAPVPEPSTVALFSMGLLSLVLFRKRANV